MRQFVKKLFAYVTITITVICGSVGISFAEVALANSAQSQFYGVSTTGAIMTDEESPIVVEHETLSFDIFNFPESYGLEKGYDASVTAEYMFYNPSEYTVTARLVFPFGNKPDYSTRIYDEETDSYVDGESTKQYGVTINDEVIEKRTRYTYAQGYFQFDTERDMELLKEDFIEHKFYSPELTVTEYTYKVTEGDREVYKRLAFDLLYNSYKSRIICIPESVGTEKQGDGDNRIIFHGRDVGETVTLYVIGDPFESLPKWRFYTDNNATNGNETAGTMILEETKQYSFLDFALLGMKEQPDISEVDRYNAVVTKLEKAEEKGVAELLSMENGVPVSYMQWYDYEITLAPGERMVNKVTAPLYPSIDEGYKPSVFQYTYLLSPAKTWKEFGTLDIEINTPFYLLECDMGSFEKTESGYRLSLSGLPEGELTFSFSKSENPKDRNSGLGSFLKVIIIGLSGFFSVFGGWILAAVFVIVLFVHIKEFIRNRKNKGKD